MRGVVASLLFCILPACLFCGLASADPRESRMIFDEGFNWITQEGADRLLDRIEKAGFNVLVPSVWHGRGTSWPSELAPAGVQWTKHYREGFDPLSYLITKAHKMGIEVHPSFTVVLRQREFLHDYYDEGTPKEAFNVHMPEFRKYIVSLMLEVLRKYDVDGINLDYIRSVGFCKSEYCQRDYRERQGRDLLRDLSSVGRSSLAWNNVSKWNSDSVDDVVEMLSRNARRIRPKAVISVDSHAGRRSKKLQGADSIRWANDGWIDVIYHMDYGKTIGYTELNQALRDLKDPRQLVLFVGNYERNWPDKKHVWSRDPREVARLVSASQQFNRGGNGVALYNYKYLTDDQIAALKSGPFKASAAPYWTSRGSD